MNSTEKAHKEKEKAAKQMLTNITIAHEADQKGDDEAKALALQGVKLAKEIWIRIDNILERDEDYLLRGLVPEVEAYFKEVDHKDSEQDRETFDEDEYIARDSGAQAKEARSLLQGALDTIYETREYVGDLIKEAAALAHVHQLEADKVLKGLPEEIQNWGQKELDNVEPHSIGEIIEKMEEGEWNGSLEEDASDEEDDEDVEDEDDRLPE